MRATHRKRRATAQWPAGGDDGNVALVATGRPARPPALELDPVFRLHAVTGKTG